MNSYVLNQSILSKLDRYFKEHPSATFCRGLVDLKIINPIMCDRHVIGYECEITETSYDLLKRLLDEIQ